MRRPPVVKKLVSIPVDIHRWLEERAAATLSPTNSIIITICRDAMDAERQEMGLLQLHTKPVGRFVGMCTPDTLRKVAEFLTDIAVATETGDKAQAA
jgi:hypothetical protein